MPTASERKALASTFRTNFAKTLTQTLSKKGMSTEDLAIALNLNPYYPKAWAAGTRLPSMEDFATLISLLDLELRPKQKRKKKPREPLV